LGPINYAKRIVSGWGSEHKQRMRDLFGHILSVGAVGESLPNEKTYVDLDPDAADRHGLPVARINAFLPSRDLVRLEFMAEQCRAILIASGSTELVEEYGSYDFFSATHVFGTCRMGSDPESSVVDRRCRAHRWRNLYVCDASVFPSSGGGESPSLTIEALALYAAAGIREGLARRDL
jgi:choline dehydrogenase-like flavoprotein